MQDSTAFALITGFHKTSARDLRDAVRASETYLRDYRSRATEG